MSTVLSTDVTREPLYAAAADLQDHADDKGIAETVEAVEKGNLADGITVPRSKRGAKTGGKRDAKAMSTVLSTDVTRESLYAAAANLQDIFDATAKIEHAEATVRRHKTAYNEAKEAFGTALKERDNLILSLRNQPEGQADQETELFPA